MLHIFKLFSDQNDDFFKDDIEFIVGFIKAIISVKPFEMCCDFLMDDEKDVIKSLVNKLPGDHQDMKDIKSRFETIAEI